MTSQSSSVIRSTPFTSHPAIPCHTPTKRLVWCGNAVTNGGFDLAQIGGVAAWLGAGAQRLARRVVYQLNSRSVLPFFQGDS
jgi:hypothetical protein